MFHSLEIRKKNYNTHSVRWRQNNNDPGSRFMRSGPPAWSKVKPQTSSASSTGPKNQVPVSAATKDTILVLKVSMLQSKVKQS